MSEEYCLPSATHAEVVICGAGPVSLFTGIVLASRGVHVRILEALPNISDSPRAVAYQPVVLSEFIEAGVYHDLLEVASESNGLAYWTGDGPIKKRVAFIPKVEGVQGIATGLNCGQPTLAKVLLKRIETFPNAQVLFDARVVDVSDKPLEGPVRVTYENIQGEKASLNCDWLIGADGSRSTVRKLLGIEFEGFTWPKEEFVATNILYPFENFGFSSGNFLLHPIDWAVVAVIEKAQGLCGESPEAPKRLEHFLPDLSVDYKVLQVKRYKPHQRCATQFRKGRVLLAGDAAHSNNPIGGLGLTSGLLDAGPLARALTVVIQGRAPDSLLDKWAAMRHASWWQQTNPQSIEYKRIMQQGGYGKDPACIWAHDELAKSLGMTKWLQNATPEAIERDDALFEAMQHDVNRLRARARAWDLAMPIDWMAEYEVPEVVEARRANRPHFAFE